MIFPLDKQIVSLTSTTLFQGQKMAIDFSIATPFEKFSRFTTGFTHNPTTTMNTSSVKGEITVNVDFSFLAFTMSMLNNTGLCVPYLTHHGTAISNQNCFHFPPK
jgi:hypothetical protein